MTNIYFSPLPDVEIPDSTVTDYVFRNAGAHPDRVAMIDGVTGSSHTFAELTTAIRALAGGLTARGLEAGAIVALMAPNMPEFAIVFHGAAVAGLATTTLNPTYTAEEIRHQLIDSGAVLLFTIEALAPLATEAIEGTAVTDVIFLDKAEGSQSLVGMYATPSNQVAVDVDDHVVTLPYSSGTTGLAKGVMLTHKNLVANLAQCGPVLDVHHGEATLAVLPFFHIYGMQVLMNNLLANGATVITLPRFDFVRALELIQEHRITKFYAVPPMILALAKQSIVDDYDLSSLSLIMSGAAPLGGDLADDAAKRVGCEVVQGFGMTELSPVSHATLAGQGKAGSCGVTIPNTESRIVDEAGNDVPAGHDGELWVRGPQVMKGYLNNEGATAATIDRDGWLHTGDVGHIDSDGHLSIVDRLKELIKYKGFQVAPAELEALLLTHDAVADCAVVGIPDDEAGELPKAFIALNPEAIADEADLREFVAGQVASYKQLRAVEFIDEIPKSASGKILRRFLRSGA